jgi:hypothetical protein
VVVWTDQGGADGSSYGVYGQRYDADDNAVGGEFRISTTTAGAQYEARVVGLTNGGFVAVWRSDNQDGSSAGVYAQRYDAAGVAVGGEFRINETTAGGQYQPDVTALADGAFAVTWYNDNYDSSGGGTPTCTCASSAPTAAPSPVRSRPTPRRPASPTSTSRPSRCSATAASSSPGAPTPPRTAAARGSTPSTLQPTAASSAASSASTPTPTATSTSPTSPP